MYDVDIWSIRKRAGRPKPWELRWRVGERPHSRSFKLKPQADGRRAELMAALRDQQQFDEETGLPARELMALTSPSWYEHVTEYVLMKWPRAAAKHRASIAEALAVVTPVLVTSKRGAPRPSVLRDALYQWAFRAVRGPEGTWVPRHVAEEPPVEIRTALEWVAARSIKVKGLEDPALLRPALEALSLRLDGGKTAENTARRKRMVLSNVLRYTVEEKGLLASNPLPRVDWTPPESDDEIDFRYVSGANYSSARAVRRSARAGRRTARHTRSVGSSDGGAVPRAPCLSRPFSFICSENTSLPTALRTTAGCSVRREEDASPLPSTAISGSGRAKRCSRPAR